MHFNPYTTNEVRISYTVGCYNNRLRHVSPLKVNAYLCSWLWATVSLHFAAGILTGLFLALAYVLLSSWIPPCEMTVVQLQFYPEVVNLSQMHCKQFIPLNPRGIR